MRIIGNLVHSNLPTFVISGYFEKFKLYMLSYELDKLMYKFRIFVRQNVFQNVIEESKRLISTCLSNEVMNVM